MSRYTSPSGPRSDDAASSLSPSFDLEQTHQRSFYGGPGAYIPLNTGDSSAALSPVSRIR